jgi:hypothetical protein
VPDVPKLSVSLSLVGGDTATLRSGSAALLRAAVAQLTGVHGAEATLRGVTVNFTTVAAASLAGLANSSANGTRYGNVTAGYYEAISASDPLMNGPVAAAQRRVLANRGLAASGACSPFNLTSGAGSSLLTVPVAVVDLDITIPSAYFSGLGSLTQAQMLAAVAALQARLRAAMANATAVADATRTFTAAWANCTGLPASAGVIFAFSAPTVLGSTTAGGATAAPGSSSSLDKGAVIGGIIGAVAGATLLALLLLLVLPSVRSGCGCGGIARAGAVNAVPGAVTCGGASACAGRFMLGAQYAAPSRSGQPLGVLLQVRVCPHTPLRAAVESLLIHAGLPHAPAAVDAAALLLAGRTLPVSDLGDRSLADVDVTATRMLGVSAVLLPSGALRASISPTGTVTPSNARLVPV